MTGKIEKIRPLSDNINHYSLTVEKPLNYRPGQFLMVTAFGVGECAISITSPPRNDNSVEMAIRKVGSVTGVLYNAREGDTIGIRGPFGNGFDISEFLGKDILFVCGGLGIVPLRSFISPVVERHSDFGSITIISGAQTPSDFLYKEELDLWEKKENVTVHRMVDTASGQKWNYGEGLVTDVIPSLEIDYKNTKAVLCGPPVMYKFVIIELNKKKLKSQDIYVDLERRMNCGVGICGHCQIKDIYVCKCGPVFKFSDILEKEGAL